MRISSCMSVLYALGILDGNAQIVALLLLEGAFSGSICQHAMQVYDTLRAAYIGSNTSPRSLISPVTETMNMTPTLVEEPSTKTHLYYVSDPEVRLREVRILVERAFGVSANMQNRGRHGGRWFQPKYLASTRESNSSSLIKLQHRA